MNKASAAKTVTAISGITVAESKSDMVRSWEDITAAIEEISNIWVAQKNVLISFRSECLAFINEISINKYKTSMSLLERLRCLSQTESDDIRYLLEQIEISFSLISVHLSAMVRPSLKCPLIGIGYLAPSVVVSSSPVSTATSHKKNVKSVSHVRLMIKKATTPALIQKFHEDISGTPA